jgi:hypothetical protein
MMIRDHRCLEMPALISEKQTVSIAIKTSRNVCEFYCKPRESLVTNRNSVAVTLDYLPMRLP